MSETSHSIDRISASPQPTIGIRPAPRTLASSISWVSGPVPHAVGAVLAILLAGVLGQIGRPTESPQPRPIPPAPAPPPPGQPVPPSPIPAPDPKPIPPAPPLPPQ